VFRGWRRDAGLKLLSIGLALLLWLYVQGARVIERDIVVPLRATGLPDSLIVATPLPAHARVRISGPAHAVELRSLFLQRAEARLELGRLRFPGGVVTLGAADVHLPPHARITVVSVLEPAPLEVRLQRRARREQASLATPRSRR